MGKKILIFIILLLAIVIGIYTLRNTGSQSIQISLVSPQGDGTLSGIVPIAWSIQSEKPLTVTIRYTSDPLPVCWSCPEPRWYTIAKLEGDVGIYKWNTSGLSSGRYFLEIIAENNSDKASIYSPPIRIKN